jgi:hypothetical protein
MTDPTGFFFSWVGKAFNKVGNWLKKNWRTIVAVVIAIVAWYVAPYIIAGFYGAAGIVTTPAVFQGAAGALAGAMAGAANAAISGGDMGDILRGALVGGIQGGISGGVLHQMQSGASTFADRAAHVAGHGILGGAANEAMGGKFQDGFVSAAAGAGAGWSGVYGAVQGTGVVGRTITAGIIGGTASALGGGKFANGAWTAAFQHLLNAEAGELLHPTAENYDPLKDGDWLAALKVSEGFAKGLSIHSEYLNQIAEKYDLNPRLIAAILINESRGWGATATTMTAEMLASATKRAGGSYGPAQLGPAARKYAGLSIKQALTARGSILGSAAWLDYQRKKLISEGIRSPNAGQISSRYNARLASSAPGTVTKYGLQIRVLSGIE